MMNSDLLAQIAPKKSPAFSANLHKWLLAHGRRGDTVYNLNAGGRLTKTYAAGTLFVGQPYADHAADTDFSGALLMAVLCNGSKETRCCLAGASPGLVEIPGFWDRYKQVGRCAIDTDHSIAFRDDSDRYTLVDGHRACTWCTDVRL